MTRASANVQRLLDAGLAPREVVTVAKGAAFSYDLNRKPGGNTIGTLGQSASSIYERLLDEDDSGEPSLSWFLAFTPFTAEEIAERCCMSRGTAASAINRLMEHGFMEKQRSGRSFLGRLLVPSVALTEYAERHLDAYEPNMAGHHEHQHLAQKVLSLYPRWIATER